MTPLAPDGFSVSVFARVPDAGWMAVAPNGDVFLSVPTTGKILLLRDKDSAGRADENDTFATGFQAPHGLVLHENRLYVGDRRSVWYIPYADGAVSGGKPQKVIAAAGSPGDKAVARDLAFDSHGSFYWGFAGPRGGLAVPGPDATIQKITPDGSATTFADGLATVAGMAFYPGTDKLFALVDERSGLGPGLVPDYLTHIQAGGFYGWPYTYIGDHPDPTAPPRPAEIANAIIPDLLFEAGSAPLDLVFYEGRQFPAAYRGDAFVVLHGSWKQGAPVGYKIVHVPFRGGMPVGGYKNFVTGFVQPAGPDNRPQIYGRPAALAVAKDGSLLIADNVAGIVWRVAYTGK